MTKAVATNPGKSDQPPPEAGAVTPEEALQGAEFAGEFGETREHLAQLDEGAHTGDVDLNGAFAVEHAGEHGDTLFGEGVRQVASPAKVGT